MADICFREGYKDEYKFVVEGEDFEWAPPTDELFELVKKWFEAEDQGFPDGYGAAMPYFYLGLIAIGEHEKANKAHELEGREALEHFRECVDEHRDEIIDYIPEA